MNKNRTALTGRYIEFQASVLRQMPRPEEFEETTLDSWNNNQKALKEALAKTLLPNRLASDSRFKLLNAFELTVPEGYIHESQLASFSKNYKKDFYYYNDNITDENFSKATNKFVPSRTYKVKIFGINQPVGSEDCLTFLKAQKAILAGAQGISLVWECKKDEFPIGKYTISFDGKDALWKDADGPHRVPSVYRYSDGGWDFYLDNFEGDWDDGYCVLCFCDSE